jgi:hypothetical protein
MSLSACLLRTNLDEQDSLPIHLRYARHDYDFDETWLDEHRLEAMSRVCNVTLPGSATYSERPLVEAPVYVHMRISCIGVHFFRQIAVNVHILRSAGFHNDTPIRVHLVLGSAYKTGIEQRCGLLLPMYTLSSLGAYVAVDLDTVLISANMCTSLEVVQNSEPRSRHVVSDASRMRMSEADQTMLMTALGGRFLLTNVFCEYVGTGSREHYDILVPDSSEWNAIPHLRVFAALCRREHERSALMGDHVSRGNEHCSFSRYSPTVSIGRSNLVGQTLETYLHYHPDVKLCAQFSTDSSVFHQVVEGLLQQQGPAAAARPISESSEPDWSPTEAEVHTNGRKKARTESDDDRRETLMGQMASISAQAPTQRSRNEANNQLAEDNLLQFFGSVEAFTAAKNRSNEADEFWARATKGEAAVAGAARAGSSGSNIAGNDDDGAPTRPISEWSEPDACSTETKANRKRWDTLEQAGIYQKSSGEPPVDPHTQPGGSHGDKNRWCDSQQHSVLVAARTSESD